MKNYAAILSRPGTKRFTLTGLIARLPVSMLGLGIVLLVADKTGSYGRAGLVSGSCIVAGAIAAPLQGRLADRWGQGRLLWLLGALFPIAIAGLLVTIDRDLPAPAPHLMAAFCGMTTPLAGAMLRTRWTNSLHEDRELLQTAFALEATFDELCFIVGPVLVTFLTLSVEPNSGIAVAGFAGWLGAWSLAAQRSTEPASNRSRNRSRQPMGWRTLGPVMVAASGTGLMLGSVELLAVAFMGRAGQADWSGAVLAIWAGGSLVAGIVTGMLPSSPEPVGLLRWSTAALGASIVPMFFVSNPWAFAIAMFVTGMTIAPTLIMTMSIIEQQVAPARLTEAMTWCTSALTSGLAFGAAVVGRVVDTAGVHTGFVIPLVGAVIAAAVAWTFHRSAPTTPVSAAS